MKLSDYHGEKALDLLAEIVEPMAEIFADPEISDLMKSGGARIKWVKPIIKNHKDAIIAILAAIEGQTPDEYADKITVMTLPVKFLNLINDKEMQSVFMSAGQESE